MKRWNALACAAMVAALVLAPMGLTGAYGDEGTPVPPPQVTAVADCVLHQVTVTVFNPSDVPAAVTIGVDTNLDGVAEYVESPTILGGLSLSPTFGFDETIPEDRVGITVKFGGNVIYHEAVTVFCPVLPFPADFNAAPVPPTCDADGALPDVALVFPNVTLSWDRIFDGPGLYKLTATATTDGFVLPNGGFVASRDITVEGALGYQSTNSAAPCYVAPLAEATLAPPTMDDPCGTERDFAYLPEDTAGVVYSWADFEDPENFDVLATVQPGFVVNDMPAGWIPYGEGVFFYAWSPEFTNEPCGPLTETTLSPPTMDDPCGTENDFAYLPETEGVVYSWVDLENPDNYDVLATVQPDFVVSDVSAGWVAGEEEGTFIYPWSPEFTDEACLTTTPPPAPPAPAAASAKPALAATGGQNMMPWGVGAAAMLIAGIALLTVRRLARR